jgi:hypothetical protein
MVENYIGKDLNWEAKSIPVILFVELPFWLMVVDNTIEVEVNGHNFQVDIVDDYIEVYGGEVLDSRLTCIYIGPNDSSIDPEIMNVVEEEKIPLLLRKCKTVLRVHSKCNEDVLSKMYYESKIENEANFYLKAFCEAHLAIVNRIIQHYRLLTYDYFPYELCPWDVPVWFVKTEKGSERIVLLDYSKWDRKPVIGPQIGTLQKYELISPADLQNGIDMEAAAGELELLDAMNFMERGDYSGAVRRITTAIEAMMEFVLSQELLKKYSEYEVRRKLYASRNNFHGRLQQYLKLSGRIISEELLTELETTRSIRHEIVHSAYRMCFKDRGRAQRSVDTGRWIYNWLENRPDRSLIREERIGTRSLGRYFSFFETEITEVGVVVHKPNI